MAALETVSADNILRAGRGEHPVREGTFLQPTGLILAASVGALASVVIVFLLIAWLAVAPHL